MIKSLYDFPNAFEPLVVIIGDRREQRPKTKGDLLVYSLSSLDIMHLNYLGLKKETKVLSDKIFVDENHRFLAHKFGKVNILTIGSPAVNLFSRQINSQSFFKFYISNDAIKTMQQQDEILDTIKKDILALSIYKLILSGEASPELFGKKYNFPEDIVLHKFNRIMEMYGKTELNNDKELMDKFVGEYIIDPVQNGILDLRNEVRRGTFIPDSDFGFVSLAPNPFSTLGENWSALSR